MKTTILSSLTWLMIASLASLTPVARGLPFWDPATNYSFNGGSFADLAGLSNVEGNAWGQIGTTAPDVQIVNYPLNYPGLECSQSNAFLFGDSGSTGYSERIAINPAMLAGSVYDFTNSGFVISNAYRLASDTIYYSYVFTIPVLGGLTSSGGFLGGFNNLVGPQTGSVSIASGRVYVRTAGTGQYQVGVGSNPSGPTVATYATPLLSPASTNFLVVSYTFVPGNGTNNYAQLWLNPDPSTFGSATPPSPTVINTNNAGGFSNDQILSFYFRQGNSTIPEVYAADLRIGLCWGCVTPPANNPGPSPATLSIATDTNNNALVSFQTNSPCYLMQASSNVAYTSNTWSIISTAPGLVGSNYVVTNAAPLGTNAGAQFYQVKTYSN